VEAVEGAMLGPESPALPHYTMPCRLAVLLHLWDIKHPLHHAWSELNKWRTGEHARSCGGEVSYT